MAKKQPPYRVISKPPKGYKLPVFFGEIMIKGAIRTIEQRNMINMKNKT